MSLTASAGDVLCAPLPTLDASGTGTNGAIGISASSVSFGQVACGTAAAPQSLTIKNVGTASFTWSASLATGTAYALTPAKTTLAPGDSGSLGITPSAIPQTSSVANDLYADTLTITTTIDGDTPHVVAIHETARGAILTTATTDVPFGGVRIDTTGTAQFSVTNAGNVATNLSFGLGTPSGPFAFAPQGGSVAAGGNATITASFTPTATTPYSDNAAFAVSNGTPLCGPLPPAISVSGTGTNGAPKISPTNLDFLLVPCGSQAAPQNVAIENTGTASFGFTAALTSGASYYTLGAPSGSVAPGDAFNLSVTPVAIPASSLTTSDLYAGAVTITTDVVGDTPHVVSLHETALGARLSINVSQLDFGPVTIGTSKDLPFSVTNDGNAAADVSYTGFTSPPVSVAPAGPVAGGASLDVTATFTPQDGSTLSQSLALQTSSGLCLPLPASIPVTGSGM
jgi:hypothetical protein